MAAGVGDGGGGGSEAKQMLPVPSEIMEMFGDGELHGRRSSVMGHAQI